MGVVATLAQVETTQGNYVALANKDDPPGYEENEGQSSTDPELVLIRNKPITSSIRATIRHIHGIGGFAARWRGISAALCTAIAHSVIYQIIFNLFAVMLPYSIASIIGGVLTTVILARWVSRVYSIIHGSSRITPR